MIIYQEINLKKLAENQKKHQWNRPYCHKCKCYFYGHGYVFRYFNQVKTGVFLKRWRCPKCHIVATVRPQNYWKHFHESISNIFKTLKFRIKERKWPPWCTRQRGGHWLNKLIANARLNLLLKDDIFETILFYQNKNLTIS